MICRTETLSSSAPPFYVSPSSSRGQVTPRPKAFPPKDIKGQCPHGTRNSICGYTTRPGKCDDSSQAFLRSRTKLQNLWQLPPRRSILLDSLFKHPLPRTLARENTAPILDDSHVEGIEAAGEKAQVQVLHVDLLTPELWQLCSALWGTGLGALVGGKGVLGLGGRGKKAGCRWHPLASPCIRATPQKGSSFCSCSAGSEEGYEERSFRVHAWCLIRTQSSQNDHKIPQAT